MDRRFFIRNAGIAGGLLLAPALAKTAPAEDAPKLVILHTNDWHSRIEPFPREAGRNAGKGGAIRRMRLIESVRAREPHVLLLDSGDIFQGTPYFNFFAGELEMKLMSMMGYDAATIGNHDFDGGMENLAVQMGHANFPLLSANYEFDGTPLSGRIQPSMIIERGGYRIGLFGLGIELAGLVPPELYGSTRYLDPLAIANRTADRLRRRDKCDLIICLSHLGFRYRDEDKVDDVTLAAATKNVDIILGGHTHTFLDEPVVVNNSVGEPVIINQVGFGGLRVGRLDVTANPKGGRSCVSCSSLLV